MINLTKNLVFRMAGLELLNAANECLAQMPCLMRSVVMSKDMNRRYEAFEQVFCSGLTGVLDLENTLQSWLRISMERRGQREIDVSNLMPGVICSRKRISYDEFKPFAKLFFILMYKSKALLLPYEFERPSSNWLGQIEAENSIWSELVTPFRALGDPSRTMQDRGRVRLIQTSSKILMTTDWYSADLIKDNELNELHSVYGKGLGGLQTPIPFVAIMDYVYSRFPILLPKQIIEWVEIYREPVRNRGRVDGRIRGTISESAKRDLYEILTSEEKLTENLGEFLATNSLAGNHFSGLQFQLLGLCEKLRMVNGVDNSSAVTAWTESQEWVLSYKGLESDRSYRTAFGRLNIWLFIYLPAWKSKNPDVIYPYPDTPSMFLPMHHIDKRPVGSRPMSLTEFYECMGWTVNRQNMAAYQLYFSEIAVSDLQGCEGVRQPIIVLPVEKAKGEVVKNILDPEDDKYFTSMLESLEGLSQQLFDHQDLYDLVMVAKQNREFFKFEVLGFIPFIIACGRTVPIRYLPPQIFHFTTHAGRNYYNPGVVRFCLFLRWAGSRGQNAQWLDANLYGMSAMRISDNPNSVDLLYMNTDKIRSYPFTVAIFSKSIWLLDRQYIWRTETLEVHGVEAFGLKVKYERRINTKWGKILPLFASDGATGEPFSDAQYFKCWTSLCLGLQSSLKEQRKEKIPLVSWIPVLKKKKVADWNTWHDRGIAASEIEIFERDALQQGIFDGPYCKVSLRCFSTPHGGGRAGFVSDISNYLSPELGSHFTGQTAAQFTKYNKGRALFSEIEGAFNSKEPEVLERLKSEIPSMYKIAEDFETQRRSGISMDGLSELGFFSGIHQNFQLDIDSLLSDPGLKYSVCATHICLLQFSCSGKVVSEIGYNNCPECPYAIFSVNNMVAVAAAVRKSYDEYLGAERAIAESSGKFSDFERERLSQKLKEFALKVISWRKVEMNLWAIIKLNQHNEYGGFLAGGEDEFFSAVQQYKVTVGSKEDFLESVVHASVFKELVSEDMNLKMDRAARMLMAGQGKIREALSMPVTWSAAEIVASEIRSCIQRYDIDYEHLTLLLKLSEMDWRNLMMRHAPSDAYEKIQGFGVITRIKH